MAGRGSPARAVALTIGNERPQCPPPPPGAPLGLRMKAAKPKQARKTTVSARKTSASARTSACRRTIRASALVAASSASDPRAAGHRGQHVRRQRTPSGRGSRAAGFGPFAAVPGWSRERAGCANATVPKKAASLASFAFVDCRFLAQPDRDLVLHPRSQTPAPREVHFQRTPEGSHRGLHRCFNRTLAKPFKWTMTGKPLAA